ncbi:MAG: hypothetical protein SGI74_05410 [Oligoflexia bacterium]|nr:hypothetical protein [Oligoflexia bacterium]
MIRIWAVLGTLTSSLLISSCALLETDQPAMSGDDDYSTYAAQKNGTLDALDELGLSPSKSLSGDERDALEKRMKLKRLERSLVSAKEREQYYNFRPYLDSDEERMAFLSLPSTDARDRYAMQRGIYFRTNKFAPAVKEAVSKSDIILGMTKEAVIESWGEPEAVEVAGSQLYGNERWKFTEYISTPEGYQREERVVIFESGKVVGWQRY